MFSVEIPLTSTLIILHITKTESNNCLLSAVIKNTILSHSVACYELISNASSVVYYIFYTGIFIIYRPGARGIRRNTWCDTLKWWYFPRALARGKYHYWRKYFAEFPERRVYKWYIIPKNKMFMKNIKKNNLQKTLPIFYQDFHAFFSCLQIPEGSEGLNSKFCWLLCVLGVLFTAKLWISSSDSSTTSISLAYPAIFVILKFVDPTRAMEYIVFHGNTRDTRVLPWIQNIFHGTRSTRGIEWNAVKNHIVTWYK